ncbi:hypothetical protein [Frigoriglobus tundricola]|uniref:Uncharacterized protein n=1 Tax=Frigoriglobus tundricola TaxID=2774151 RepID=A0A6M5YVW2_9BACT|nr:hypothetical protein [Frigoriglobus tundricola]QJW97650.1 hypothetical protein FTUN_5227 [Frigoriglobus tundricola]
MTSITNNARVAKAAQNADTTAAEQLLRDMAYVLKLTRRVKDEMTADRARTVSPTTRNAEGALVA